MTTNKNQTSKYTLSPSYLYRCFRNEDEIRFQELHDEMNRIATEWTLKIGRLKEKETFKHLTVKELKRLKALIEEIIEEKVNK